MSQKDLAVVLGVYQATISQWEQGKRGIRHPGILALALDHLDWVEDTEGTRRRREWQRRDDD